MTQKETIVYLGDSLELKEYHTPYDLANNTLSYKGIFKPLNVYIEVTPSAENVFIKVDGYSYEVSKAFIQEYGSIETIEIIIEISNEKRKESLEQISKAFNRSNRYKYENIESKDKLFNFASIVFSILVAVAIMYFLYFYKN